VIGWNKDSGDESKWEAFHAAIGGKPIQYFRVGTGWVDCKCQNQVGAYTILENAKNAADQYGYKVFDSEGVLVYQGKQPVTPDGNTQARTINALPNEQQKAAAMLELVHKVDKSGILPSVTTAQMILESGYCGTDLAVNANNCFGMKKSLSGNTWPNSTWDGKTIYTKKTQEDDGHGNYYWITADFRKYPCVENSIMDHSAYLLGAMNGNKKRYAGLTDCKNYKDAITLIKNGGYATDTRYIAKICDIIQRFGLDKYDKESGGSDIKPEPKPTPTPDHGDGYKWYRVRKAWSDEKSQIGAYEILNNAISKAKANAGYKVFDNYGNVIYDC
jgi:flagellum-specific peptidoglycan hydrolase FlgJ